MNCTNNFNREQFANGLMEWNMRQHPGPRVKKNEDVEPGFYWIRAGDYYETIASFEYCQACDKYVWLIPGLNHCYSHNARFEVISERIVKPAPHIPTCHELREEKMDGMS